MGEKGCNGQADLAVELDPTGHSRESAEVIEGEKAVIAVQRWSVVAHLLDWLAIDGGVVEPCRPPWYLSEVLRVLSNPPEAFQSLFENFSQP